MALTYFYFSVFFLIYCFSSDGLQQSTITNLRQFNSQLAISRFAAPRDILAEEIRNLKEKDGACGNDVKLELHQRTRNMTDISTSTSTGQFVIIFGAIQDYTLKKELPCEMKEKIAVTYRYFGVTIPFTSGTKHGIVHTSTLSDSPKLVLHPYLTNYQTLKQIDRMEETSDGTIIMYKGDDVMTLNIQYDKE
ncbi:hypothetical protein HOLleu_26031 [Holothuria leucospilota]|uniref:Uncharacterized protein n=1 Tax=Holothuria leucospilota TaxID=206669 RepID=A0A9Q1H4S9_HOLLE|nr:hypothetical protein HOLleu_26031 [Holothuria leucospilota]